jgi:hypothetical protein
MVRFSRYLDPGGDDRDAERSARPAALDAGSTSPPATGFINERAFAAALPPVDDNLLPKRRRD